MFEPHILWGRFYFAAGFILLLSLGSGMRLAAQELPLKRDLPGTDSIACPEIDPTIQPSPEEVDQANRLGSDADQALMLGNQERARDLLARATELDPISAELAYRYGRILEALDETELAVEQFCRALALGSREQGIGDARPRLEALARALEPEIPEEARDEFLNGLLQADVGNFSGAEKAFGNAFFSAPHWADAVYNRGVANARLGDAEGAVEDFERYLTLRPDAQDAIQVSRRVGQLQVLAPRPNPGKAFSLGLLMPGLGQFHSGRTLAGVTVLAFAGASAGAGVLSTDPEGTCSGTLDCRPFLWPGLGFAAVVTVAGALESFFWARDTRPEAGTVLALGLALPGMGQFSTGRAQLGLAVVAVSGAATAVGVLSTKESGTCSGTLDCRPHFWKGLAVAGAVSIAGAFEAFGRRLGQGEVEPSRPLASVANKPAFRGPSLSMRGPRLDLNLFQVLF